MKPKQMLAVHRTNEKNEDGVPKITVYTYDGIKVRKLSEKQLLELSLPGMTVRMTSVNALDSLLAHFEAAGATVESVNWHDSGVAKNLTPEEIVKAYYESTATFRVFKYNRPLAILRNTLAVREAHIQAIGDYSRRLQQIGRNMGLLEKTDMLGDPTLALGFTNLDTMDENMGRGVNPKGKAVSIDTILNNQAKEIPLCVLFNKVAGLGDSYVSAATIASIVQDITRFPNVASLWSYFGEGVVNGKAPKRAKGQSANWSARGRKTLFSLGDSIIKNRNNPWRTFYDSVKADEQAKNEARPEAERISPKHLDNRARRKMVKEILKRFYVAAMGQKFNSDHFTLETQSRHVAVGATAGA